MSAREIQQPGFVDAVREALSDAGMAATRLSLEITETALLKATPSTIATLEDLRELGVRVVIDDFGTGYFSLSHLRQFPVDILKIASEFVQVPEGDSRTAALAGAIVAMGGSLRHPTVAEGIETAEQAARMRELGCTFGQGYYFAQPMSGDGRGRRLRPILTDRSASRADDGPSRPRRRRPWVRCSGRRSAASRAAASSARPGRSERRQAGRLEGDRRRSRSQGQATRIRRASGSPSQLAEPGRPASGSVDRHVTAPAATRAAAATTDARRRPTVPAQGLESGSAGWSCA